jgi:hypothetical protein
VVSRKAVFICMLPRSGDMVRASLRLTSIFSALPLGVKVKKSEMVGFGEHCGRDPVERSPGAANAQAEYDASAR